MKKVPIIFASLFIAVLMVIFFDGCKKDDNPTDPGGNGGNTVTANVSGVITDEFGQPLNNVEVKIGDNTTTSTSDGVFNFTAIQVNKDRFVVNAKKTGYFTGSRSEIPGADKISVNIVLLTEDVSANISSSTGGEAVLNNGSKVQLPSDAVVKEDGSAYTGNVKMAVKYLDPTSENFSEVIPGGDLTARRNDNSSTTLQSFGIMKVNLTSTDGSKLQVKSGKTSTITMDIPSTLEGEAPATIPLWYYSETEGIWIEEGVATKQGDKYVGTVNHFSDWNCDVPQGTATIKGLVVDCKNQPVPGLKIIIGQTSTTTGSDGKFERRVPANVAFQVQPATNKYFGVTTPPINAGPYTEGQIAEIGTIHVECPVYVTGLLTCQGTVENGQVVVSWEDKYVVGYTDGNGKYNIPTDVNKVVKVRGITFSGKTGTTTVTTPSVRGESVTADVTVCDQMATGENSFIINGDGFNNKKFVLAPPQNQYFAFGWYDASSDETIIYAYDEASTTDSVYIALGFKGNKVGKADSITLAWVWINSNWYFLDENQVFNIAVTQYGGIGELIQGTFSGGLIKILQTGITVEIKEGKFGVTRIANDKRIQKYKDYIAKQRNK
ncbi:MAG TPA: carboxypeptidase-like regulatory domain-containing protein [Ignavibacteriaceae bacterium]|nr:carboxypeptidase-like regulatory domain-containing protein [Ignavibacteriaceae bacterium]